MRFYTKQHQFYCGVDLHASVMYCCILDSSGKVVFHKNIPTKPKAFLELINPIVTPWWSAASACSPGTGWPISVPMKRSTSSSVMRSIHGGKAKNDKIDSYKIVVLLRGGSFSLAYTYPKKMRATRDLLRRLAPT